MALAVAHLRANGTENYRHGARSKETIELWKLIKSIR
jgi:hypothetical protein